MLNDDGMMDAIQKEVATLEDIEDATSEHVLMWACRGEVQGHKRAPIERLEAKEVYALRHSM